MYEFTPAAPPPPTYRSAKTLAILAIVALAVVAVAELLMSIIGLGQVLAPELTFDLDGETQSVWYTIQGVVALFSIPFRIAAIVLFLVWLNRANKNMEPLLARNTQFTSGWAVGWWFVPFWCLVRPFQVVREVWSESNPEFDPEPTFLSESLRTAPVYMGVWWAMWLVSNVASNVAGRAFDPDKLDQVALSGTLFAISGVLTVVAAGLAIWVVWDITRRQERRWQRVVRENLAQRFA